MMFLNAWTGVLVPMLVKASASTDLVSNLLTGGGFVFLATVMGGLALWNKNQSESAKTIAEGSATWAAAAVADARIEVGVAKQDAKDAREDARAAREEAAGARADLKAALEDAERERRRFRSWIRTQKNANDEHNVWDDELKAEVERLGGNIRPAPPLATCSPEDPDFPAKK